MTMGAPAPNFNGGLLRARARYFDLDRKRPGLPLDVAALVEKIEADRTVVHLVNTSALEGRRLILQASSFGEHQITEVKVRDDAAEKNMAVGSYGRPHQPNTPEFGQGTSAEEAVPVDAKFFAVTLPPGTSITLDVGVRRFANKPGYAFPWHDQA